MAMHYRLVVQWFSACEGDMYSTFALERSMAFFYLLQLQLACAQRAHAFTKPESGTTF